MRRRRFDEVVGRLRGLGLPIDAQVGELDMTADNALGRPTIARALIAAGHATSVQDAFARLIGHGCPGYVPRGGLGTVEAIAAIRAAGGLAVLAHFAEAEERSSIVRALVDVGLAGLEVYYLAWGAATVARVRRVAESFGLVQTGGTDYHGDLGTYAEAHARLHVPDGVEQDIRARLGSPVG
jgi:predicted metal-dependent phosphoesterase TrpH